MALILAYKHKNDELTNSLTKKQNSHVNNVTENHSSLLWRQFEVLLRESKVVNIDVSAEAKAFLKTRLCLSSVDQTKVAS